MAIDFENGSASRTAVRLFARSPHVPRSLRELEEVTEYGLNCRQNLRHRRVHLADTSRVLSNRSGMAM
ncbi:hypothetical protein SAMN05446635_0185 [Burkholderia sp. OK233]|nr:hypothetical protein SAMN05446635_0185 [Burkholderia sp. OK233]